MKAVTDDGSVCQAVLVQVSQAALVCTFHMLLMVPLGRKTLITTLFRMTRVSEGWDRLLHCFPSVW